MQVVIILLLVLKVWMTPLYMNETDLKKKKIKAVLNEFVQICAQIFMFINIYASDSFNFSIVGLEYIVSISQYWLSIFVVFLYG